MKKKIRRSILSAAIACALLCSVSTTALAASPLDAAVVPAATQTLGDDFYDSTPFKDFTGSVKEYRLADGQSFDFYVTGLNADDVKNLRWRSEDTNVATVQYIGYDTNKGLHFKISAKLNGTPKDRIPTGEAQAAIVIEHKGNGGTGCNVIVTAAGKLGLSTVDVKMTGAPKGSTADFYVLGANDTGNIKITNTNPTACSIQLVNANADRGAQYRITASPITSTVKEGITALQVSHLKITKNGETKDLRVIVWPVHGSIMVDTTAYTMPTVGGKYQIGLTIKDAEGRKLEGKEVKWLVDHKTLIAEDSRTGSIVDLKVLDNGDFLVTSKKAGSCYITFHIDGGGGDDYKTRASVKIDVKDNAKAQGASTRDTSYWALDETNNRPLKFTAMSQYYRNAAGNFDEQAIINDVRKAAEKFGMVYDGSLVKEKAAYPNPEQFTGRGLTDYLFPDPKDHYLECGFGTQKDSDAWVLQRNVFSWMKVIADDTKYSDGTEVGQKFKPIFVHEPDGDLDFYFLWGSNH